MMTLFVTPFICAALLLMISSFPKAWIKKIAVMLSLPPLFFLLYGGKRWLASSIDLTWIPPLGIHFHLQIDSLSLVFLYLTAIIVPITLLATPVKDLSAPAFFYSLVFVLQGLLIGFFTARDLAVFTFFWEAMLLPLYFMINFWGGEAREKAAFKFIIYMIAGSALMVAAVLALYFTANSFNMDQLAGTADAISYAPWIAAVFLLAFCVKTPLFPFHGWLPDAYCQASTPGTILLAALLSKAGIYGIMRIGIGLFPSVMMAWSPILIIIAIVGVLYGALAAWMQTDFKRLIAYSSFSHVNFILAGLFVLNQTAHEGAILQALNHGITITALFLVAAWLEKRIGSTAIDEAGGLAKFTPYLCWVTLFFVLSSVALPGTNNFIGELLILFGLFGKYPWLAALLGISVILSVVYMLRWMQRVYFETPRFNGTMSDIGVKEMSISIPLIALIVWIGLYPMPILELLQK